MNGQGGPMQRWTLGRNGGGHHGHGWMMIACCVPMLVIALVLVFTGVLTVSYLLVAVACTVMMAMMMGGMGRSEGM
ncbi:hypothetical protein [Nocardia sp. NPDC059691]|uniref:hypothetical protein n=1 Tax=Nocardia sp. NPDC059691 TaxID=3346908 RepID=UPI0036B521C0